MDGFRDSTGTRISLLNEAAPTTQNRKDTFKPSTTRTPSLTSSPSSRISRADSSETTATSLPSPKFTYSAPHLLHPALSLSAPPKFATGTGSVRLRPLIVPSPHYYYHRQRSSYTSMDQYQNDAQNLGPVEQFPFGDPQGLQMTGFTPEQMNLLQQTQPQVQLPPSPSSAPPSTKKKNSYPCPVAKAYACNEYFTTSGHAARHAKKHTGKKDAICPECKKAFTRKDNMEQHRRTHSSVRGQAKAAAAATGGSGEEKQAKKAKQATKKANAAINNLNETAAAAEAAMPQMQLPNMNNMPNMHQMMPAMPMGMAQAMPQQMNNINAAAMNTMDMNAALGMLDPRLMGDPNLFQDQLAAFAQQLQQQQHQQLQLQDFQPATSFSHPTQHRSSYDEALPAPQTPDSIIGGDETQQNALLQSGNVGSPSAAPALDALALAASRQ